MRRIEVLKAEVTRRELVEDDYARLLAYARQRHMQALEALSIALAELEVSVDVIEGAANADAERVEPMRRAIGGRR